MATRKRAAKKAAGGRRATGAKKGTSTRAKKTARAGRTPRRPVARADAPGRQWNAIQRSTRQSPYKMRLVIDEIRGRPVNDALAYLQFSKKHAAKQIEKVLRSAVANAEYRARDDGAGLDVDELYVKYAVINEGPKLKRFTPAAMGRATPIIKRTSHVEIVVAERGAR
jgi:large subunit ribosomal protein L22